jgi:cation:H+ antiporter
MFYTTLMLFVSIVLVFVAALIFVDAIEWIACRLRLGGSFVGAILTPLFTSLPELTVFLVAVFAYSGRAGQEIGIGTIFGEPFMASSLSYGLVGVAAIIGYLTKKRSNTVLVIDKTLAIPYIFITVLFPLTLVPSFLRSDLVKHLFGLLFLGAFVWYIWLMYRRRKAELIEDAYEPYFYKLVPKTMPLLVTGAIFQLIVAVIILYFGSRTMVHSVDVLATGIGISPMGLALIIVPAATAIPETASALIWGYRGRDTLSLGSLVGEKVLYSTFYPALGLFLTSWVLDIHAYLSVIATTIMSLILLYYILKQKLPWYGLCFGLFFFIAYAVMIFVLRV